jgi:hypothetical protein
VLTSIRLERFTVFQASGSAGGLHFFASIPLPLQGGSF